MLPVLYLRERGAPSLLVEDRFDRKLAVVASRVGVHQRGSDGRDLAPRRDPELEAALTAPSLKNSLSHCSYTSPSFVARSVAEFSGMRRTNAFLPPIDL